MLETLMVDPSWVLGIRTPFLNWIFITFSHYFNFYTYMYVITLGYWIYPKNKVFVNLGFLFPFTVVLNSMIKGLAHMPRPDENLHLIKAFGVYGFPSGDAMLTSLVWFTIFIALRGTAWRYLCFLPILLTAFSRVYLGIHTINDVTGGVFLGILVSYLFHTNAIQSYVKSWYKGQTLSYWVTSVILFVLYMGVYRDQYFDPFIFSFAGMVIGYGVAAPRITERYNHSILPYTLESYMNTVIAVIVIYILVMYTQVTNLTGYPFLNYGLIMLKYAVVSYLIFAVTPWFIKPAKP